MARRTVWRMPKHALAFAVGWASSCIGVSDGYGAEWTVEPAVNTTYEVNDNRGLTVGPHSSVHGLSVEAALKTVAHSESNELQLSPRVLATRYSDGEQYDSTNRYLSGRYAWLGERDQFTLNADA